MPQGIVRSSRILSAIAESARSFARRSFRFFRLRKDGCLIKFELLVPSHPLWEALAEYAQACPWRAGESLARDMHAGVFVDWERVIAAMDGGKICGYCTAAEKDCIPEVDYTPYIGYVYVDEACRGQRLSQRMFGFAMDYLRFLGFGEAYLVSDYENLYEKYGFVVVDRKLAPWGSLEKIYRHDL